MEKTDWQGLTYSIDAVRSLAWIVRFRKWMRNDINDEIARVDRRAHVAEKEVKSALKEED